VCREEGITEVSIKARLLGGFCLVAVASIIVAAVGLWAVGGVTSSYDQMVRQRTPIAHLSEDLYLQIQDMKLQQRTLLVAFDKEYLTKQLGDVNAIEDNFKADFKKWDAMPGRTEQEKAAFDRFRAAYTTWMADKDHFMSLVDRFLKGDDQKAHAEARALSVGRMRDNYKAAEAALEEFDKVSGIETAAIKAEADGISNSARPVLIGTGIVTLLAALALGLVTAGSITKPLSSAVAYANLVSEGHLEARFPNHTGDEIGSLTRAIECMKDDLVRRMFQLREMAGVVSYAADEVTHTSGLVVQTTERLQHGGDQAGAVAELGSAARELEMQSKNLKRVADAFNDAATGQQQEVRATEAA
jgi:methyl-accepting chemotaxis protein